MSFSLTPNPRISLLASRNQLARDNLLNVACITSTPVMLSSQGLLNRSCLVRSLLFLCTFASIVLIFSKSIKYFNKFTESVFTFFHKKASFLRLTQLDLRYLSSFWLDPLSFRPTKNIQPHEFPY